VPLVEVYSYQQYLQAREAVTKEGG
jgi:hypothetical protein